MTHPKGLPIRILRIGFQDFWPGFDKKNNFFTQIFRHLKLPYSVENKGEVDVLIWSVFPIREAIIHNRTEYSARQNWFFTGENVRPNPSLFDASFSFDFNSAENHFRLPLWWFYLDTFASAKSVESDSALKLSTMTEFRQFTTWDPVVGISAYIGNMTPLRSAVLKEFEKHIPLFLYGSAFDNPIKSKMANTGKHMFTLCFENEYFPGYHTEKLPQAWALESVPLYYGARTVSRDFNDRAFINLDEFQSISQFVDYVISLPLETLKKMVSEPLLERRPNFESLEIFVRSQLGKLYGN